MLKQGHFLSLSDFSRSDLTQLLDIADAMKRDPKAYSKALEGRILLMIFELPFLRTRVSFESGMQRLGGTTQVLSAEDIRLDYDEPITDTAAVFSRYVDALMVRTSDHEIVRDLAKNGTVPVINGLTDREYPCQALADLQTVREKFGRLEGLKLTYIGDGNNMAHALLFGTARMGMDCTLIMPRNAKYQCLQEIVEQAAQEHADQGTRLEITSDIQAAQQSHIIYTDTWVSVGRESDRVQRIEAFRGYSITPAIMDVAGPQALFMHCLPAYRGYEVMPEVIDGPRSIVYDQAENRMWSQMAVLYQMLGAQA